MKLGYKKLLLISLLSLIMILLFSCNKKQVIDRNDIKDDINQTTDFIKQNNIDKVFNIASIEFFDSDMDHVAYHGFFDYLKSMGVKYNLKYDFCAESSLSNLDLYLDETIGEEGYKDIDLFYCIGYEAVSAIRSHYFNSPAIATNLIKPEDYLVNKNDNKIKFAAIKTMPPIDRQVSLFEKYKPMAKNIGIVYSKIYDEDRLSLVDYESEYQFELAKEELVKNKYNVYEYAVNYDTNFDELVEKIQNEVDAVYLPVDRFVLNNSKNLLKALNEKNIFTIAGNGFFVSEGANVTLAIDYYNAGIEAGKMAYEYLVEGYPIERFFIKEMDLNSEYVIENDNINKKQ